MTTLINLVFSQNVHYKNLTLKMRFYMKYINFIQQNNATGIIKL